MNSFFMNKYYSSGHAHFMCFLSGVDYSFSKVDGGNVITKNIHSFGAQWGREVFLGRPKVVKKQLYLLLSMRGTL